MNDNKPHTILSYTNGPGYLYHRGDPRIPGNTHPRIDLTHDINIGNFITKLHESGVCSNIT